MRKGSIVSRRRVSPLPGYETMSPETIETVSLSDGIMFFSLAILPYDFSSKFDPRAGTSVVVRSWMRDFRSSPDLPSRTIHPSIPSMREVRNLDRIRTGSLLEDRSGSSDDPKPHPPVRSVSHPFRTDASTSFRGSFPPGPEPPRRTLLSLDRPSSLPYLPFVSSGIHLPSSPTPTGAHRHTDPIPGWI